MPSRGERLRSDLCPAGGEDEVGLSPNRVKGEGLVCNGRGLSQAWCVCIIDVQTV